MVQWLGYLRTLTIELYKLAPYWIANLFNLLKQLQLILHNPADMPTGIKPTAYIINRSMLTISLSLTIVRASPKIEKWTPKTRNCYFQHEKILKFFKIYTYQNCELECIANNTLHVCGCNAFYQPSKNSNCQLFNCTKCPAEI